MDSTGNDLLDSINNNSLHNDPDYIPVATAIAVADSLDSGTDNNAATATFAAAETVNITIDHNDSFNAKRQQAQQASQLLTNRYDPGNVLDRNQIQELRDQGFPVGLAQELGHAKALYPLRFWVVDNSGSMRNSDGHQLKVVGGGAATTVANANTKLTVVQTTRWTELQESVQYHAKLAGLLKATTVFKMLNNPGVTAGPQEVVVAHITNTSNNIDEEKIISEQVDSFCRVVQNTEPRGVTPLTLHLLDIKKRVEAVQSSLLAQGQQAVVVLATDGLPSNSYGESTQTVQTEFVHALKSMQSLPIWVVVRLCTDDSEVVEYYNNLDSILELPLEVIDDFWGEAQEIKNAKNNWLTYGLPIHRCREMGYHHRIFDLLDERMLNKDELREFLVLLFGSAIADAPDMHADWKGFMQVLTRTVKGEGKVYNPVKNCMEYWVDLKKIEKSYGQQKSWLFGKKR